MNVEDYQVEVPAGDMLEIIFTHQRQLMDRYHSIEEKNVGHYVPSTPCEHGPHCGPLDINDRAAQLQMKSFAWRITEEVTEATLCLPPYEFNETHYLEELADALHFSVELCIMAGIEPKDLAPPEWKHPEDKFISLFETSLSASWAYEEEILRRESYKVTEKLGEGMNRLKLKPWKTTAMLTDIPAFRASIIEFFWCFIDLLKASGFTPLTATQMYLNKNAVNQFRIGSNY